MKTFDKTRTIPVLAVLAASLLVATSGIAQPPAADIGAGKPTKEDP